MFLDVKWTISETDERGSVLYPSGMDLGLGSSMDLANLTQDQIKELFEKTTKLADQNADLEQQIDLVLNAKNNLEKILKEERKATEELKK